MNLYFLFTIAFIIIWFLIFILVGYPNFPMMTGGSFALYLLLPVFVILPIRIKGYIKLFLFSVLFIICIVAFNYLYWYFTISQNKLTFLTRIAINFLLIWGMLPVFVYAVYSYLPMHSELRGNDKRSKFKKSLLDFGGVIAGTITIPCLSSLSFIFILDSLDKITTLSMLIVLGGLLLGVLIFCSEAFFIPTSTLAFFINSEHKNNLDLDRTKKYFLLSIAWFVITSIFFEFAYRGFWIICLETDLIVLAILWIIYKFGLHPLSFNGLPGGSMVDPKLPSLKSSLNISICIFFILLILTVLIVNEFYLGLSVPGW